MRRKNIFDIARSKHLGPENQLTELLAYLWQECPEIAPSWLRRVQINVPALDGWQVETQRSIGNGFLDLVLFVPGEAIVIVESKLGSTTDLEQMSKYVGYASQIDAPQLRAVILMTKEKESLPAGVADMNPTVRVIASRWHQLAETARESELELGRDFAVMLEKEEIAVPEALVDSDWEEWRKGRGVAVRIAALLNDLPDAADDKRAAVVKWQSVTHGNNGHIYRTAQLATGSVTVGLWPTRNPAKADQHALINVIVVDGVATDQNDARARADHAAAKAGDGYRLYGDWGPWCVIRQTPTQDVLSADTASGQATELAEHMLATIDRMVGVGYLPPSARGQEPGVGAET